MVLTTSFSGVSCSELISAETTSDDVTMYLGSLNNSVVMIVAMAGVFVVVVATLIAAVAIITICMAKVR